MNQIVALALTQYPETVFNAYFFHIISEEGALCAGEILIGKDSETVPYVFDLNFNLYNYFMDLSDTKRRKRIVEVIEPNTTRAVEARQKRQEE